jgi:hypothetical protein
MKASPGIETDPPSPSSSSPTQIAEDLPDETTKMLTPGNGRRSHRRYPLDLGIRLKQLPNDRVSLGKIRDLSSGGVRFTSSETLAPGMTVELSIDWPARLGHVRVQLKCSGRVLRSDGYGTAVKIECQEFCIRTQTTDLGAATAGV